MASEPARRLSDDRRARRGDEKGSDARRREHRSEAYFLYVE
jgi:hypothetical protein